MSVSGVTPLIPSRDSSPVDKKDELGQDDFLNLLIAQLQAQDPLNPLKSAEFTAQLAQFNSLEKLIDVNTHLEELKAAQLFSGNAQFVDYIGKTVTSTGNLFEMADGADRELHFDLAGNAKTVFVNVVDANGLHVRTLESGQTEQGERSIEWNGKDDGGHRVPDGIYGYEVAALDSAGNPVAATPYARDRITGVTFQHETAYLLAGNKGIPITEVIRVSESDAK